MDTKNMNLEQMKNIDVQTVDRHSLADIQNIKINRQLPRKEQFSDFISQIKNPYCYRCGKAIVKVSFASTGITLEDKLEQYLKSL